MTCAPSSLTSAALGAASLLFGAAPLSAQLPVPTPPAAPATSAAMLAPYRAPLIALVQPAPPPEGTGAVSRDRPAIVLRYAAGEADDPLDVRSLVVAVDGADRTMLFQTTSAHAWGPLASEEQVERGELAAGPHRVIGRICSMRGVCASAEAQVLVMPGIVSGPAEAAVNARSGIRRVLGAMISATRKLLL